MKDASAVVEDAQSVKDHDCFYQSCPPRGWYAALAAARKGAIQSEAAKSAGVRYKTVKSWLERCPKLRKQFDDARDEYFDLAVEEAIAAIHSPIDELRVIIDSADRMSDRVAAARVSMAGGERLYKIIEAERSRESGNRNRRRTPLTATAYIDYKVEPPPELTGLDDQ